MENRKVEILIEKYFLEAKKDILKENKDKKAEIVKLSKQLLANGVNKTKIDNILSFYKFSLESTDFDVVNDSVYEEVIDSLNKLADKEGSILPQE